MKTTADSMTNLTRNLLFSLLIISLVSMRGSCLKPRSSGATGTPPYSLDDYDDYEDTTTPPGSVRGSLKPGPAQRCDYDPCRDEQTPCVDLSLSTGCLCPGFTLYTQLPDAPQLTSVSRNGSGVLARWCAPYSYVTAFTVTVGGLERQSFGEDQRRGLLGEVAVGAEVCVVAVNDAGSSEGSCVEYRPRDDRPPLTAWLVGGAGGLLLLVLLAAMLWRHRRQEKQEAGDV